MKKFISLILSLLLVLSLAACGSSGTSSAISGSNASSESAQANQAPISLRIGSTLAANSTIPVQLRAMADRISQRTDGGLKIEVFADSLLGKEAEMYESVFMGTLDMIVCSIARHSASHSELVVEDLPYMFDTREQGYAALDGDYGKLINDIIGESGEVRNLGFLEMGFRHITNNIRPIVVPDDCKGIKIRTTSSDLRMAALESMGAMPNAMSFSEVFTALQQKVVDGQESPLSTIESSSFSEVQKYLSLTGHFWTNNTLTINEKTWQSIPTEWQDIFIEELNACVEAIRKSNTVDDETLVTKLESEGMVVNEVDKEQFRAAMSNLYSEYESIIGEDLMNAYRKYVS